MPDKFLTEYFFPGWRVSKRGSSRVGTFPTWACIATAPVLVGLTLPPPTPTLRAWVRGCVAAWPRGVGAWVQRSKKRRPGHHDCCPAPHLLAPGRRGDGRRARAHVLVRILVFWYLTIYRKEWGGANGNAHRVGGFLDFVSFTTHCMGDASYGTCGETWPPLTG